MTVDSFSAHPLRVTLNNELHARPATEISGPATAICLAFEAPSLNPASGQASMDHLISLLDLHGAPHPAPGSNHYYGKLGRHTVKWERHSEFETYTFIDHSPPRDGFVAPADIVPAVWAKATDANILTACLIRIGEDIPEGGPIETVRAQVLPWFESESLAISAVLDEVGVVASDFRVDAAGYVRFALHTTPGTGPRRRGRIVQRLIEIETYKTMAMLSHPVARAVSSELTRIEPMLANVVHGVATEDLEHEESLGQLLEISAELENLLTRHASRFSAAEAYSSIITQRIHALRESRVGGWQTLGEFMMRRFDPAMRTCSSTQTRLMTMATRAARAGEMLRTRTDVARAEQNQAILHSLDARAEQQIMLQKTVEGLSVVAISYYAVSLGSYLMAPLAKLVGLDKSLLTALIAVPIIAAVWLLIRRIHKRF